MKKINFILPGGSRNPIGGYKVIYEYANKFAEDDYIVNIILPATLLWKEQTFKEKIKGILRYFYFLVKKEKYLPNSWFNLNTKISTYWVPSLEEKNIPDADYIFATACQTAEYVKDYSMKKGKKLYLIQSYENWSMEEERLLKTWKSNMKKIVISKFLETKGIELNQKVEYIPNGLNFEDFYFMKEINKEDKTLMMLYHKNEFVKQTRKALKKIIEMKNKHQDLKLILFGVDKRESAIPEWVEYYQLPTKKKLRELYNRSTVYISPSKIEGWALPPAEAMQCKTCVCVTDIAGHEYVEHKKTGYKISENLENLTCSLEYLIFNDKIRKNLEKNGNEYITNFTFEKAYFKLKKVLEELK